MLVSSLPTQKLTLTLLGPRSGEDSGSGDRKNQEFEHVR